MGETEAGSGWAPPPPPPPGPGLPSPRYLQHQGLRRPGREAHSVGRVAQQAVEVGLAVEKAEEHAQEVLDVAYVLEDAQQGLVVQLGCPGLHGVAGRRDAAHCGRGPDAGPRPLPARCGNGSAARRDFRSALARPPSGRAGLGGSGASPPQAAPPPPGRPRRGSDVGPEVAARGEKARDGGTESARRPCCKRAEEVRSGNVTSARVSSRGGQGAASGLQGA